MTDQDKTRQPNGWVKFSESASDLTEIRLNELNRIDTSNVDVAQTGEQLSTTAELDAETGRNNEAVAEMTPSTNKECAPAASASGEALQPIDSRLTKQNTSERNAFKNGKILCAVYPENTSMAWIIPARYNPYSMPKTLADDRLSLPAEDYVTAMEMITNDYRFRCFCIFYSRLLAFWISLSIIVLVLVLLSQPNAGLPVLIFTVLWMLVFFVGIIAVLIIRKQILVGLRHCVQSANKFLVRSDILAGVDDRGVLSCHKVVIIFMFLRTAECLPDIERLIRQHNLAAQPAPKPLSHKEIQEYAELLILKYSNNFVKDTTKKKLTFPTRPLEGVSDFAPKHCQTSYCLCQYIEKKHFNRPPRAWYDRIV